MLIDVTRMVHRNLKGLLPTGVDRVSTAYLEHYAGHATALVRVAGFWRMLGPRDSGYVFEALLDRSLEATRRMAWIMCRGIAWPAGRGSTDQVLINAGHSGLEHPRYALEVCRRGLQPIYFAHDLIPITHPEYSRAGEDQRHRRRLKTMLETGKAVIVNSKATRTELADYASTHRLPLPECVVAPLAPARLPPPSGNAPLACEYFVILGTIEPRKNHALLLKLWRALVEELGEAAPRLVVIGRRGWKCEQVVELLDRCPTLRGYVVQKPRCDDSELSNWLHHAKALLFPSFAEGFGLPLVEALSLGVPVIASDLPVFRETAGEIPEYLDPLDSPGWRRAILEFLQPGGERRRLQKQRMRGYSAPTWKAHFQTVDMLMDLRMRRPASVPARGGWGHVARA